MNYESTDSSDAYENDFSDSSYDSCESGDTELYEQETPLGDNEDGNTELYEDEKTTSEIEYYPDKEDAENGETEADKDTSDDREGNEAAEDKEDTDDVDPEVRAEIEEKSEYSSEINDSISSVEELEVYQNAGLKEDKVNGRTCLVREDIDYDYVEPKTGLTNRQLMERGRAPYDVKSGDRIELHHIGQDPEAPLAELTENSEHGEYTSVLHKSEEESWRKDDPKRNNHYNNVERPKHWTERAKGG